jgi:hypothetical protein
MFCPVPAGQRAAVNVLYQQTVNLQTVFIIAAARGQRDGRAARPACQRRSAEARGGLARAVPDQDDCPWPNSARGTRPMGPARALLRRSGVEGRCDEVLSRLLHAWWGRGLLLAHLGRGHDFQRRGGRERHGSRDPVRRRRGERGAVCAARALRARGGRGGPCAEVFRRRNGLRAQFVCPSVLIW